MVHNNLIMEIVEMTLKLRWNKPSEGELPNEYGKYYTVDNYNEYRIMTFHPKGGWGGMNWEGDYGSNSMKSNQEIKYWTTLLSV